MRFGRQLSTIMQSGNQLASYTYNADGLRTSKTVSGVTTEYYWMNGTLYAQKTGGEYLYFLYDESGMTYGFVVKNNTEEAYYYYEFNLQGDIIGIINSAGTKVVEYTYGAWGDILSISGSMASTIGQQNPLRYRGYYYDGETGLYYLQSRYYDTEVYRFINMDALAVLFSTLMGLTDKNLFAYCDNNPVVRIDENGQAWGGFALAGGGIIGLGTGLSLKAIGSTLLAGLGAITPAGWAAIATVAVVGIVIYAHSNAKSNSKSKQRITSPIGRRNNYNSRKKAEQVARKAGGGRSRYIIQRDVMEIKNHTITLT